jgi:hypothetical protein
MFGVTQAFPSLLPLRFSCAVGAYKQEPNLQVQHLAHASKKLRELITLIDKPVAAGASPAAQLIMEAKAKLTPKSIGARGHPCYSAINLLQSLRMCSLLRNGSRIGTENKSNPHGEQTSSSRFTVLHFWLISHLLATC